MSKATKTISTAAAVLAGIGVLAAGPATAQSADFEPPRLSNGNPDLNGIWQALNAAHYDVEPHIARPAMQLRQGPRSPLPDVPVLRLGAVGAVPGSMGVIEGGGRIPYTPEARALKEENQANWVDRDPEIKCYMPGVPRATYMPFPFQIFQNENNIFIAYEFAGAVRDIYLEDVGPAETDSWMGQSVGRWEGDTLVVEVTGQNDQTWFDRAGSHHTNQLRVVERYTLIGPNHIQYEATMEDPNVFTEPWAIRMPLYRRVEPGARLMDFKCVEFVEELLFGDLRRDPAAALGAAMQEMTLPQTTRRPAVGGDVPVESKEVPMRDSIPRRLTAGTAVVIGLAFGTGVSVDAQENPRTANGRPDLSGTYDTATLTPLERPVELGDRLALTEEEAAAIAEGEPVALAAVFGIPADRNIESAPPSEAPPVGGDGLYRRGGRRRRLQHVLDGPRHVVLPDRRPVANLDHHRPAERPAPAADRRGPGGPGGAGRLSPTEHRHRLVVDRERPGRPRSLRRSRDPAARRALPARLRLDVRAADAARSLQQPEAESCRPRTT